MTNYPTRGENEFDDPLAPAEGILAALLISAVVWAVIGGVLYFTFFGGM